MIRQITIEGLKVEKLSLACERAVLLQGPVGSGKSAIGDAIAFAALGYVPRVGKSTESTAKLLRGSKGAVRLVLDDGRSIERALGRSSKGGKWAGECRASWLPPKAKLTEAEAAVVSLFGASDGEAAENLDVVRLLSVSGAELAKRVEQLLGSVDASAIEARFLDVFASRLETLRETVDGLMQPLTRALVNAAKTVAHGAGHVLTESGIVSALEEARSKKNSEGQNARRAVEAAAALEDRIRELKAPAESLDALNRRREALASEVAATGRDIARWKESTTFRAAAAKALSEATEGVARAAEVLDRSRTEAEHVATLRARAAELTDPPDVAPFEPVAPNLGDADRLRATADQAAANLPPEPKAPAPTTTEALLLLAKRDLDTAQASPWREVAMLADHIEPLAEGPAKRLRELATLYGGGDVAKIEAEIATLEARAAREAEANAAFVASAAAWQKAKAEAVALAQQAENVRRAETAVAAVKTREERAHWQAKCSAREALLHECKASRDRLTAEADALATRLRVAEIAKAEADRALDSARSRVEGMGEAFTLDEAAARKKVEDATVACRNVDEAITLCRGANARRDELKALRALVEDHTANRDAWAAAEWAIARLRDQDMQQRAQGFEAKLRTFLEAAGREEVPFLRCEKGGCEFGWRTPDGSEVAIEALSGGQAVIYRAALAYAVVALRAPAERVLLVELAETCDGETEYELLRALAAVSEEVQVIAATCVPIEASGDAWQIVDVEYLIGAAT